jgi:hemerythrin superfamily protein
MTADAGRDFVEPGTTATALRMFGKVPADAMLLLEQDHREVESCFAAYAQLSDKTAKQRLRDKICMLLKAHMVVEEAIFYPEARAATGDDAMVDHAVEEHTEARRLIGDIESGRKSSRIDAAVEALQKAIEEHVSEEETQFFPKVRKADIDAYALGALMAARRVELLRQLKAGAMLKSEMRS